MSILVARHIKNMLFNSSLADKVGERIFLDGLSRETEYPFIVYTYTVSPGDSTKDGDIDVCPVSVFVFSNDGDSSLEIADEVRKLLSHSTGDYGLFSVIDTEFTNYSGMLDEDVYVRELNFNVKTER